MHLVYRALERNPVPLTLPAEMVPPSKRKHGAGLAGAVAVMPGATMPGPAAAAAAGAGAIIPGPAVPLVPGATAAVPLVPGTAAVPVSTAGRTSPTSVSNCYCYQVTLTTL